MKHKNSLSQKLVVIIIILNIFITPFNKYHNLINLDLLNLLFIFIELLLLIIVLYLEKN